jgi:DNA-binding transcriptional MerR regulator
MPSRIITPEYLTVAQAAYELGASPQSVRNWTNTKLIKAYETEGGHRRYLRADVELLKRINIAKANGYNGNYFALQAALVRKGTEYILRVYDTENDESSDFPIADTASPAELRLGNPSKYSGFTFKEICAPVNEGDDEYVQAYKEMVMTGRAQTSQWLDIEIELTRTGAFLRQDFACIALSSQSCLEKISDLAHEALQVLSRYKTVYSVVGYRDANGQLVKSA